MDLIELAMLRAMGGSGSGGSASVYTFRGSVATVEDLPTLGVEAGDVYDVQDTGANYAWTGTAWDALGQIVDVEALEEGFQEALETQATNQEAALNYLHTIGQAALRKKVDAEDGKGLSTNDYTTAEKTKLAGIAAGAQVNSVIGVKGDAENAYRIGNINITKDDIGLGNVDNTADADKPAPESMVTANLTQDAAFNYSQMMMQAIIRDLENRITTIEAQLAALV